MTDTPELTPDAVVSLREITADTLSPVLKLSDTLSETQRRMVAPNAVSIAEAHFSPHAWFRAIYADETPVGFLMLYIGPEDDERPADEQPVFHFIWRLMIAASYQGKGYGRAALERLMDQLRAEGVTHLAVSCHPGDEGPEGFYRRLGFERDGKWYDDEVGMSRGL
jgi:diamine N-acetyltransferase